MDREAWWTTVLGVSKESETTKQLKQQPYSRISTLSLWVLYMPPPLLFSPLPFALLTFSPRRPFPKGTT